MGWWVMVGDYGQGPQLAMTSSRSITSTIPSSLISPAGLLCAPNSNDVEQVEYVYVVISVCVARAG